MLRTVLFVMSFLFPGTGQMVNTDWKKGILFFLFAFANPVLAVISKHSSNSQFIAAFIVLLLLNVVVRLWSATDAAVHAAQKRELRVGRPLAVTVSLCCIALAVVLNSFDSEKRFLHFTMPENSSIIGPQLPARSRILAAAPEYWEEDIKAGDFVIVDTYNAKLQKKVPFIFKVQGVMPQDCPSVTEEATDAARAKENGTIPGRHYLVGVTDSNRLDFVVPRGDIVGKALYVYWPLGAMRKL